MSYELITTAIHKQLVQEEFLGFYVFASGQQKTGNDKEEYAELNIQYPSTEDQNGGRTYYSVLIFATLVYKGDNINRIDQMADLMLALINSNIYIDTLGCLQRTGKARIFRYLNEQPMRAVIQYEYELTA